MRPSLRLYTGDSEATTSLADTNLVMAEPEVTVPLGQICQILADAVKTRRAWLKDFADDRVQISADLYDVLSTYWNLRPSA
jgi:hypothetical protein